MAGLFTVETNHSVASTSVMTGLMTMATRARLILVAKVMQNFSKAHEILDGALDMNSVMTNTIVNIFPALEAEKTRAMVNDITIIAVSGISCGASTVNIL